MELSQRRGQKSALEQNLAELAITDKQVLRSPVKGQVAAINVHAGDTASAGAPLIIVAPDGSRMEVELFVPTKAAGFIAPGQSVKLMVDAFPNERFGEVDGVIETVSRAPVNPTYSCRPIRGAIPSDTGSTSMSSARAITAANQAQEIDGLQG